MGKYNFYDYHLTKASLPVDINEPVEKTVCAILKSTVLEKQIKDWRENHRFGDLSAATSDGLVGAVINFQNGIVIRYWLIKRTIDAGTAIEGKWSVKNDNIYHKKTNKMEKELDNE